MRKLFYSQNSPYARIARIALIESGLGSDFELVKVTNRSPDSPLLKYSPIGRVPTLVDHQLILGEAKNICQYFDHLTQTPQFVAINNLNWQHVGLESQIIGFLDGIAFWVRENRRDEIVQSIFLLEVEQQRALRCLKHFESVGDQFTTEWNFQSIAMASALDLMTKNRLMPNWKKLSPNLYQWYINQTERQSMQDTAPR